MKAQQNKMAAKFSDMWPFRAIIEARKRDCVELIVQSAEAKGIHLFPVSSSDVRELFSTQFLYKWHSDIRGELLCHEAIPELLKSRRSGLKYTFDFFIQQVQTKYEWHKVSKDREDKKYAPLSPVPEGYFKKPVGITVRTDYGTLLKAYRRQLSELEKEIRDATNEKCERQIAEIRKMDLACCPQCDGNKGSMCPPSRVSQHGDERWTKDEEEWVDCSYCEGSGSAEEYKNRFIEFERNHSLPTSISYQMNELHLALQRKGVREPAGHFPVYLKMSTKAVSS